MAIWKILVIIGILYNNLVHFYLFGTLFHFWYHVTIKIWQPYCMQVCQKTRLVTLFHRNLLFQRQNMADFVDEDSGTAARKVILLLISR
jgi:hypothetical protein